jgi:hypothetical protein
LDTAQRKCVVKERKNRKTIEAGIYILSLSF